ncbi:hypothetical protein O181_065818 [Austropuccinia psidii MF-1]|uniref:Cytochrome P450 n=1 Tax=Austropuccinia psidii MF-1 TaxID=1389203 RepID=A0A9Q3I2Z7_9BASI|nr:hypothetical protein [Austropuccinia psidii MF-1]
MEPSIHKTIDSLIETLYFSARTKQAVDLCDVFFKFTLESFVHMTFGKDLCLLKNRTSSSQTSNFSVDFVESFDSIQNQLDFRFSVLTAWKLVEKLNTRLRRQMNSACNVLNDFSYSLIDERQALAENERSDENLAFQRDLLGLFMAARDERGGGLSRTELRDASLNLIVAGRDTTAQALSWAFYHLLMNPEIISRIREEANDILSDAPDDQVTYDNYKSFAWSQASILEALRLHPSVPKNLKFALRDDKIPGGPTIEAGDGVRWSDWTMARDPEVWGEDCGEYRPTRWIDESGKIRHFGQWKFHAFNGGPRVCLGMNLAIFEAVSVIVQLLEKFEIEFFPGWLEHVPKSDFIGSRPSAYSTPKSRPSLTLPMAQPMMVSIKLRERTA